MKTIISLVIFFTIATTLYAEPLIFDRSLIEPGEKLNYRVFMFGKLLPLGTASLEIKETTIENKKYYLFEGNANGGYLIFNVILNLKAFIDYKTLRPSHFIHHQDGFEQRTRKLTFDFDKNKIIYQKKIGSDEYIERARTDMLPFTRDPLSTLYFARSLPNKLKEKMFLKTIEKRHIWSVCIETVGKKELTLLSGKKCTALLIKITPEKPSDNQLFRGLFGLEGEIMLWVSEDKKIPLLIEGNYMFGFIPLKIIVMLNDWQPDGIVKSY